jgi:integrase
MQVRLRHVNTVRKKLSDGTVRTFYYHRLTKKRIEGEPGTLEFQISYDAAASRAKVDAEMFVDAVAEYFGSQEFDGLGERTKADYRKFRKVIEDAWPDLPLAVLGDKLIRRDLKKWHTQLVKEKGPRQADLVLATMSRIVSFAVDSSLIAQNHIIGIARAYKADRSDAIWTLEDVSAFMEVAHRQMKLALILALHLGRRQGDLIQLTWSDYDGERIAVTNRKGGRKSKFKARCTETLRATLDAAKRALGRIPHKDERILTTVEGGEWVESHFSTKFSATKNRAGLTHLHFHDLRGTAITVLAESGCTNSEIASITGHSMKHIEKIIDTYMARTRKLNDEAVAKLERSWIASVGAIE